MKTHPQRLASQALGVFVHLTQPTSHLYSRPNLPYSLGLSLGSLAESTIYLCFIVNTF